MEKHSVGHAVRGTHDLVGSLIVETCFTMLVCILGSETSLTPRLDCLLSSNYMQT